MPIPKTSELFTGGIAIPFRANAQGGTKMTYGDEYVKSAIVTMVADCDSENPFQQELGIALDNVFQIKADARWMGRTRARIIALFDDYFQPANLAKLVKVEYDMNSTSAGVNETGDGEAIIIITFLSIESNTQQQVKITPTGGRIGGFPGIPGASTGGGI